MRIKLQEYLKKHQYARSNKEAKRIIRDQIVLVNGVRANSSSIMVAADKTDSIQVGSSPACSSSNMVMDQTHISFCLVYNKPCGMICTQSSTENGKECKHTLQHIDPPMPQHFQPVGRLDQHSHGLLLFSRDGRLASALLSPSSGIERVYRIVVRGDVGINENKGINGEQKDFERYESISRKVQDGVQTDYGLFQGRILSMERDIGEEYEHLNCGEDCGGKRNDSHNNDRNQIDEEVIHQHEMYSSIEVAVKEGKKRMVRRLFAALGLFVVGKFRSREQLYVYLSYHTHF